MGKRLRKKLEPKEREEDKLESPPCEVTQFNYFPKYTTCVNKVY